MSITGVNNDKIIVRNRQHDWNKLATDFNKLDSLYLEKGIMTVNKIGNASVRSLLHMICLILQ